MALRVALLGIYHESNTFIPKLTTIEDFKQGHWLTGPAVRKEYTAAYHEIGGMIEIMDEHEIALLPVMYAAATPGGIIERDTCEALLSEMFTKLDEVLPVDGCLVVPHGAAVSELYPDLDGHWLSLLRKKLGKQVPIIGTLDPHANVSEAMIQTTDALVAYKTNPHVDQREVGKEAARLMIRRLKGTGAPCQHFLQLPMAISIDQQYTSKEPVKSLYKYAAYLLKEIPGIISTSIILGFPYADVHEMGASFILISDGRNEEITDCFDGMLALLELIEDKFVKPRISIKSLLPEIASYKKPVLLLDMGDNIGGGSSGASTFLLTAIEDDGRYASFICICDAGAVVETEKHAKGEVFFLSFGRSHESEGEPFATNVQLLDIVNGVFTEANPRHGGQVNFNMGKTAIVLTPKGNTVMITSLRMPPFSLSQLTTFGIIAENFDVVVAKGVNAPIAAYEPVCKTIVQVDTPGVTTADMTKFEYKNRRKPLFPFE